MYVDGTISINGFGGDNPALRGGIEVLTIPLKKGAYFVRSVDTFLATWDDVSVIRIPEGMPVTELTKILSPEQAKSYFARNGITMEYYDPTAETEAAAETETPTGTAAQEE